MRTRGRWKDIPGRRNDLSKGKEVGTHEEHLKAGDRLVGSEPTSKERSLVKETNQVHVSERSPVGSAGKLDGSGEQEAGRPLGGTGARVQARHKEAWTKAKQGFAVCKAHPCLLLHLVKPGWKRVLP